MESHREISEEEKQANLEIWNYALGFTAMAVVKCAIQLQIADYVESHGGSITHQQLCTAVGCSPQNLHRIMRYLISRRFFKKTVGDDSSVSYSQTPLSKLLLRNGETSIAPMVLLHSNPPVLGAWQHLSSKVLDNGVSPWAAANGKDLWEFASENPELATLFNEGMACTSRQSMAAVVAQCPQVFTGINTLVDVGGGNGTTLRILVKAFPRIHGIDFDLPHVVAASKKDDGIEYVAGNMFESVPKADAAFLMMILHDWSDEECVSILNKCREAIPLDTGKVIIVEAVLPSNGGEEDKYSNVRLTMDMIMLTLTETGKERTFEEWDYVIKQAGFSRLHVNNLDSILQVIEAYP